MPSDELLTADEVAAMLRIKPATIRKWRAERRIPFVKLNGAVRFKRADIEKWIDERVVEAI